MLETKKQEYKLFEETEWFDSHTMLNYKSKPQYPIR